MSNYRCVFCDREFEDLAHIFCIDLPTPQNIGLTACAKALGVLCPNCIPNIVVKIHLLEEAKDDAESTEEPRELEPETLCGGAFIEREAKSIDLRPLKSKDDRHSGQSEKDNVGGQAERFGEI